MTKIELTGDAKFNFEQSKLELKAFDAGDRILLLLNHFDITDKTSYKKRILREASAWVKKVQDTFDEPTMELFNALVIKIEHGIKRENNND